MRLTPPDALFLGWLGERLGREPRPCGSSDVSRCVINMATLVIMVSIIWASSWLCCCPCFNNLRKKLIVVMRECGEVIEGLCFQKFGSELWRLSEYRVGDEAYLWSISDHTIWRSCYVSNRHSSKILSKIQWHYLTDKHTRVDFWFIKNLIKNPIEIQWHYLVDKHTRVKFWLVRNPIENLYHYFGDKETWKMPHVISLLVDYHIQNFKT